MNDKLKKELLELAGDTGIELSDEALDGIAGGYLYHDEGDAATHRKEAFYVIDNKGKIVMRVDDANTANHWASNLRTTQEFLTKDEFDKLRKANSL